MKLKHIAMAGALLASSMSIQSCTDFLEIDPLDAQTSDSFFKTSVEARQSLLGVYEKLRTDFRGTYIPMAMTADILSDDAYTGGGGPTDMLMWQNMARFKPETNNQVLLETWKKCYIGIQRANTLLANYDNIAFKSNEEDLKNNYKGEAMFLRGHYYFELARYFENVPLVLEPLQGDAWEGVTQATPQELYAAIAADMLAAIELMAEEMSEAEAGRLDKYAAKAELLKVYMFYTGVYQTAETPVAGGSAITKADAIAMADDVINNSGAVLEADYADLFNGNGNYSQEVLFEIPFAATGSGDWGEWSYGNIQSQMAGPRGHNSDLLAEGWGFGVPTHSLADSFEDGDARKAATIMTAKDLIDATGKQVGVSYTYTGMFTNKYTTHKINYSDVNTPLNWAQNYHYIRLADIMLIAAELNLDVAPAKALALVNDVRSRAGLFGLTAVTLDDIYKERRTELALEGHRYWDLLRRGVDYTASMVNVSNYELKAPVAADDQYITDKGENLTGDIGDAASFEVNFKSETRGFMPIPQEEIDLMGENIKQNAGY
ncbi:RagB/SusD family nutrient uptake outer membrane protein [Algivirga pacifica]|uniref:RagB/SusD family nutrient uptake outer membrane protein n=1 Tax=Algivirga pacifica TaxID=1162670 RepID=A0ABP9DL01_9BACT